MERCFGHSAREFPDFPFFVNAWLVVRVVGLLIDIVRHQPQAPLMATRIFQGKCN